MTTRRSAWRCAGALATLMLLGATEPAASLALTVENLRHSRGMLRICVTGDPRHFPNCKGDPAAITRSVAATEHTVTLTLAPRRYAVSLVHDENGNGKLDTMLGIPREGFAFSRNPPIRFGPPRFDETSFEAGEGRTAQTLRVKYLL